MNRLTRIRLHPYARSFFTSPPVVQETKAIQEIPINFDIAAKIEGGESQILKVKLKPGQVLRAEAGNMRSMTDGIQMDTNMGNISSAFKRFVTGENMFLTNFTYTGETTGTVVLASDFPSKILRLNLQSFGGSFICQKGAFLAGSSSINIEMEFVKRLTAGFFGGEGFILQRLQGEGDAFVKACGSLLTFRLEPEEKLRISSGCLVGFSPTVQYDVQMLSGFKNVVFGGEGLFITQLTGPGIVFLQSMPFDRLVDQIARRIPTKNGMLFLPSFGGSGESSGEGEGGSNES